MNDAINWPAIGAALAEPFPAEAVQWRPQGKTGPRAKVQVVAYLDARDVQDRLDAVVGVGGWAFDWTPLATNAAGDVVSAKGTLTLHSVAKSDVGTASHWEPSKGCVSDALKRAAVHWGIGRYLYALPAVRVTLDDKGAIPEETLTKLQASLRRRFPSGAQSGSDAA